MLTKSTDRTSIHNGHLFINAVHWLYRCPLCCALMAKADKIAAKEITNEQS